MPLAFSCVFPHFVPHFVAAATLSQRGEYTFPPAKALASFCERAQLWKI